MAGTATAPQVTWDDEEKQQPAATPQVQWDEPEPTPKAAPATPAFQAPKTVGEAVWSAVKHANPMAAASDLSTGIGKVGDWLHGKSEEAHQQDLSAAAAGKPTTIDASSTFNPASMLDLGARTAKTVSGMTSPTSIATGAAAIAAPEIVAPALVAHGGLNTIEGIHDAAKHGLSPEAAEQTLGGASEAVGGAALGAHRIATGPGPLSRAISERNPVERGTQAYQKVIAPTASKAIEQMDDVETIKRAMPYLGEQERLTPVKPGAGAGPEGQRLGVLNYRQNAQVAADRLWNEKIVPLQDNYGAAPVDYAKVANDVRSTIDPHAPPNEAKARAVNELADHYNQPTTVKEALAKVKALNDDKQVAAYNKALPDQQAEMIRADPAIEAKVKAADSWRDAVFDSIEQHGSKVEADYVREARKDFGSLKQVSKNLGNSTVPTPGSFAEKLVNTARVALRPRSAPGIVGQTLFNDPNKLAAKSSRLFGAANQRVPQPPPTPFIGPVQPGQAPPRLTPWAPPGPMYPTPAGPAAAQAFTPLNRTPPNAAGQVTGIGSVQNPQAVGPRGTAGTRFAPKGLLPGPIAGTPVPQVGAPPPVGFPARIGLWEGFPNPNAAGPGFEQLPRTPVTMSPQETGARSTVPPRPITPFDMPSQRLDIPKMKPPKPETAGQAKLNLDVPRGTPKAEPVAEAPKKAPEPEPEAPKKKPEGVLPGMEEHVAKQAEGAAKVKGEDLTREANTPKDINAAAGGLETKSPLFRGTEASPQREIFGGKTEPTPAVTASKPLREEYSPQEIEEAELMLKQEVGATKAGETPRRMFHESEAGDVRTGSRQIRGGDWQGVKSGRNLFPFLKAYPEFTASMIEQALKRPNSPTYERIVSRAAKLIRDEKLTTEQKGQRFEAEQANPNRPANALDLIEGLKAFRKPKL